MSLLKALQRPTKTYDISVSMTNGMAASPSHTRYSMALRSPHGDRDQAGKVGTTLHAMIVTGDHVGPHMDALCHVDNKGILHGGIAATDVYQGGLFVFLSVETINGSCYILLIVIGIAFSPGQGCAGGIVRHVECDEGSRSETQNAEREAGLVKVSKVGESALRLGLNNPSFATCGVK
jgi:hypothetical protein